MRDERLVPLRLTLITLARILRFLGERVFDLALTIHHPAYTPDRRKKP